MFDQRLLDTVPDTKHFFTVEEYDARIKRLSDKYSFELRVVGKSSDDHPIYLVKAGTGQKRIFVWGFPHPNEPVGELTMDWFMHYVGENGDQGYTWYFVPNADPDGSRLDEGWFKNIELKNYFMNYYRPAPSKQMEWVFPVEYKDFVWDKPMPENIVMMDIIKEILPDVMYPLHNAQIGGAYFFATERFDDEYFDRMLKGLRRVDMPLHMSEPEEEFMREMKRPFYYDFTFKDYYENEVKLGRNPLKRNHGDNSTGYLQSIKPDAIVIKGEIPYFYDDIISDTTPCGKTRRELWLAMIDGIDRRMEIHKRYCTSILDRLHEPDLHYYVVAQLQTVAERGNSHLRNYVETSESFGKIATVSEEYDCVVMTVFADALSYGQLRRAALKISRDDIARELESKIDECVKFIKKNSNIQIFSIKKLVQTQVLNLLETLNYLERKKV